MNTESVERKAFDNVYAEVKLCTAKEALRHEVRQIVVPENAELLLSPSHPELANCFVRVHIKSYEDLQLLGFVPRKLSEEKVRQAIAADNEEVYRLASSMASQLSPHDCECQNQSARTSVSFRDNLRATYDRNRKAHNPALGRLLSDHFGAHVPWDDPLANITRKWIILALDNKIYATRPLLVVLTADITINRDASLIVDSGLKSLLARDIWIHRRGRLVQKGTYIKIWANSVRSFQDSNIISAAIKVAPPWSVGLRTE